MVVETELTVLGTVTTLLRVTSHLAIFFTRLEWRMIAPFLLFIYPALAFLLYLIIDSFESDLSTCIKYLFSLIDLCCIELFTTLVIVKSLCRNSIDPQSPIIKRHTTTPDTGGKPVCQDTESLSRYLSQIAGAFKRPKSWYTTRLGRDDGHA